MAKISSTMEIKEEKELTILKCLHALHKALAKAFFRIKD
jgi:hypothetical protein